MWSGVLSFVCLSGDVDASQGVGCRKSRHIHTHLQWNANSSEKTTAIAAGLDGWLRTQPNEITMGTYCTTLTRFFLCAKHFFFCCECHRRKEVNAASYVATLEGQHTHWMWKSTLEFRTTISTRTNKTLTELELKSSEAEHDTPGNIVLQSSIGSNVFIFLSLFAVLPCSIFDICAQCDFWKFKFYFRFLCRKSKPECSQRRKVRITFHSHGAHENTEIDIPVGSVITSADGLKSQLACTETHEMFANNQHSTTHWPCCAPFHQHLHVVCVNSGYAVKPLACNSRHRLYIPCANVMKYYIIFFVRSRR